MQVQVVWTVDRKPVQCKPPTAFNSFNSSHEYGRTLELGRTRHRRKVHSSWCLQSSQDRAVIVERGTEQRLYASLSYCGFQTVLCESSFLNTGAGLKVSSQASLIRWILPGNANAAATAGASALISGASSLSFCPGCNEMLVFRQCSPSRFFNIYFSYSALSSFVVTRSSLRVQLFSTSAPTTTTYSNISYPAARGISVARMSATVAIPQQPHSQHPPATDDINASRTSSSSRASSSSGRTPRKSTDDKTKPQSGNSRMSGFFPLGYKEAASQWVSLR